MPTGYTADIAKGISFETFIMNCARAFGALVMMRDDPQDAPIPDRFEPDDYHVKVLEKAQLRLVELSLMSLEDAESGAHAEYVRARKQYQSTLQEKLDLRSKYETMMENVCSWAPPSAEHSGLKTFMIEQISESIKWDCTPYSDEPKRLTGIQWISKETELAKRDIRYHTEENEKEIKRAEDRTKWVQQLRDSIKSKPCDSASEASI